MPVTHVENQDVLEEVPQQVDGERCEEQPDVEEAVEQHQQRAGERAYDQEEVMERVAPRLSELLHASELEVPSYAALPPYRYVV